MKMARRMEMRMRTRMSMEVNNVYPRPDFHCSCLLKMLVLRMSVVVVM